MMTREKLPDWRDDSLGSRIRVALWLATVVGEGNVFTKAGLRTAVTGREQVDRRMRELRAAGWVIKTYRDTTGLAPGELLLERIGAPIWAEGYRSAGTRRVSSRVRREVMERDHHRCVRCGIVAGELYPDDPPERARLTVGHVTPFHTGGGSSAAALVTECARCNEPARHLTGALMNAEQVWIRISELRREDKERLLRWMSAEQRDLSRVEEAWASYRQLPGIERERLQQRLAEVLTPR